MYRDDTKKVHYPDDENLVGLCWFDAGDSTGRPADPLTRSLLLCLFRFRMLVLVLRMRQLDNDDLNEATERS